jgi:hypothetical protein
MDIRKLEKILNESASDEELFNNIVNCPFSRKVDAAFLFLGIIVLLLVNKKTGKIDRVALSDTELAKSTTRVSAVPFRKIKIPLKNPDNIIARAIQSGEPQDTTDWKYLFTPALKAVEARINQASAGISYSVVFPLKARDGGAIIFSYFQYESGIGKDQKKFMKAYSKIVESQLQN